jgi:hypothetical protein
MDEKNSHLEDLKEIRFLMEKSSSFLSLSGLSGVSAGIVGILATVCLMYIIPHQTFYPVHLIIFSIIALVVTFSFVFLFTFLKARRKNVSLWNNVSKKMAVNLFIPLITGGIFSLILLFNDFYMLLPSVTLLFYGMALINASKYTFVDIKYLGLAEMLLGLFAALFINYGIEFWGAGFGLLNILYGIIMYLKYEK